MEEKVLLDKKAMWYKKKMQAFAGRLIITDKMFSFNQDKINAPGTGLLGSIITSNLKKTKGGEILNEPLENLQFTKGKKLGRKSFILEVETPEKEIFKFLLDERWVPEIETVVKL
jgi:hypothetical protein